MCELLQYSRSVYYDRLEDKEPTALAQENERLEKDIITIFTESDNIYGAPKIHKILKEKDEYNTLSLKRVQRHMKNIGIASEVVKKFKPHSKNKVYELGTNLLERDFRTTNINEKWVCDITYINTKIDGWCYLASVLDLHTKKIIGYSFGKSMTTILVEKALDNAITNQKPSNEDLIIHTDRGSQYTSNAYREKIENLGFKLSYSAKGCPYDNACIESFHAILKKELVYRYTFKTYSDCNIALFKYIEGFYNRRRIHSALNYKTPDQVENLCRAA